MRNIVKKALLLTGGVLLLTGCGKENAVQQQQEGIYDLCVQYQENPIGIDESPVFSWKMQSNQEGAKQKAYQIILTDKEQSAQNGQVVWDSGKVETSESVAIPYEGLPLASETRYQIDLTVWTSDDRELKPFDEAFFETGILSDDWEDAKWIQAPESESRTESQWNMTDYEISYDFESFNSMSGCIFGAQNGRYGKYVLVGVDNRFEDTNVYYRQMDYEEILSEDIVTLSEPLSGEMAHHMVLRKEGERLLVLIDDKTVYETAIEKETPLSGIGFCTERGDDLVYYDNLVIRDEQGLEILSEMFEGEDTIFSPYAVKTQEGRLRMDAGYLTTAGGEMPAWMFRREFSLDKKIKERAYMQLPEESMKLH